MGGFIKVSLKENNNIITTIVNTNELNDLLGTSSNIFHNDINEKLITATVKKNNLFPKDFENRNKMAPFNYGYIFIDRDNKELFYINDFKPFCYYYLYSVNKDDYDYLKENNFNIMIESQYDSKRNIFLKKENINVLEKCITGFKYEAYYQLNNCLNDIDHIILFDKYKIYNIKELDDIFNNFFKFKAQNKKIKNKEFIMPSNDLELVFKEWKIHDLNSTKDAYIKLYEYLISNNLLSNIEKEMWFDYIT